MRTHNQLLDAILAAWPTKEEVAQLNLAQIETLRGAGNALDNILFLATPKGRAAAYAGKTPRDNPYTPGDGFSMAWSRGWHSALGQASRRLSLKYPNLDPAPVRDHAMAMVARRGGDIRAAWDQASAMAYGNVSLAARASMAPVADFLGYMVEG